jgi:hypothetical protein
MTAQKTDLPLQERIDRFLYSHHDVRISAPWATQGGKWEVSEPDRATVAYDNGFVMISELEKHYTTPQDRPSTG